MEFNKIDIIEMEKQYPAAYMRVKAGISVEDISSAQCFYEDEED